MAMVPHSSHTPPGTRSRIADDFTFIAVANIYKCDSIRHLNGNIFDPRGR
jgi:hypothetical protein